MSTLSSSGSSLQVTGLASGLDTNSIIQALLSDQTQRITNLTNTQTQIKNRDAALSGIQSGLRTLALNAQALGDPGLFSPTQTVTSSNSGLVSATSVTGAGIGGYQVDVTQLASSAQRTFTLGSGSLSGDTITIDGHDTALASGASSITDVVNAINSDPNATVYAAATNSGTVVFSSRQTGDTGTSFIQVSDSAGLLTQTLDASNQPVARQGKNALYSVDGIAGSSASDTVTNAIPGVTLTLNGVTGATPATIVVSPPAASTSAITKAVQTFVNAYNSMIDTINGQITQKTSTTNPNAGLLFGDNELTSVLSNMRTTMYSPGAGLPAGMASLADIGVSTGAASGSSPFSQDAVSGKLTIDSTALANAIQSNPNGVKTMLQSWSQTFSQAVNSEAAVGGSLDARLQGDSSEVGTLGDQITNLNTMLSSRQTALQAQFAAMEATLASLQSQNSWLTGQLSSLLTTAQLQH